MNQNLDTNVGKTIGPPPSAAREGRSGPPSSTSALKQTVPIARWIIFFQAGLLGVTATTFFIFGLMVGNVTAPSSTVRGSGGQSVSSDANSGNSVGSYVGDCRIAGDVMIKKRTGLVADTGAVVIVLPEDANPKRTEDPSLVMPERFVALDNPAIESIHNSGGAIVRADRRGLFEVLVDQNRRYILLVISKGKPNHPDRELTKQQLDLIGKFFAQPDKLVQGKEIFWTEIETESERIEQPTIEF